MCSPVSCAATVGTSSAAEAMIPVAILQRFVVHRRGVSKVSICLLRPLQLHAVRYVAAVAVNYIEPCSLTEEHGCLIGIPREPGNSIGVVSRLPQRARRAMGLLTVIRDSRCGSTAPGT
ncbi:exported protein of unknown function [Methanoculleus bourgensis]|uniref:Uncharacterized protein n=1 Tax=Methanoculleus bourgensis TaxID=83986 RepID=A0A0X3BNZ4_9EURY|nr:exported protein of unknown function [Methanoculleus bourgensis]